MDRMNLIVSGQLLNTIGAGLKELPYKIAAPAIAEIQAQVDAALAAEKDDERRNSSGSPTRNSDGESSGPQCPDPV